MEQKDYYKVATFGLIVFLFLINFQYQKLKTENSELKDTLSQTSNALEEANGHIDDANAEIEEAQNTAWSDYEDMGYALENLSTVETVTAP